MQSKIFSVYDEKAQAYLQPFFMPNRGMAVRAILSCIQDSSHQFNRHAADFSLFELGTFDDTTGKIEENAGPALVNTILQLRAIIVKEEEVELKAAE